MDMGMKMYFHAGLTDKNILIYGWNATDGLTLTATLVGYFLFAVFYEWIKFFRIVCHKDSTRVRTSGNNYADIAGNDESFWTKVCNTCVCDSLALDFASSH